MVDFRVASAYNESMNSKVIALCLVVLVVAGVASLFYFFSSFNMRAKAEPISASIPSAVVHTANAQAFILPVAEPNYLPIRDFNVPEPVISAKAAGLFDTKSEKFLFNHNIDQPLPIASITKLMTAVIVTEKLDPNATLTIAAEDVNVDGHGADLAKDEKIGAHDLLKIMLIKSSNDAASSFATLAKTQGIDFVAAMNAKAQELGMTNTHFLDPAGLDDNAHSTVRDLVRLYSYINDKHKDIWEILRMKSDDIASVSGIQHHVVSTDQLLGLIPHIIGGKTGYTDLALGTMSLMVLQAPDDNLISIVLGSNDRFGETQKLIEWAKTGYRWN